MSEISTELKDRVLSECKKMLPKAEEVMSGKLFSTAFVRLPILIDGVIDALRYNVKEKQFDRLEIFVATEGLSKAPSHSDWTVYCDRMKIVYIDLRGE